MNIQELLRETHNLNIQTINLTEPEHVLHLMDCVFKNDFTILKKYKQVYRILTKTECKYVKYYILQKIISNHSQIILNHDRIVIQNLRYHILKTFIEDETIYNRSCIETCLFYHWLLFHLYIDFESYDDDLKHVIYETTLKHFNYLEDCRYYDKSLTCQEHNQITLFIKDTLDKLCKHLYLLK